MNVANYQKHQKHRLAFLGFVTILSNEKQNMFTNGKDISLFRERLIKEFPRLSDHTLSCIGVYVDGVESTIITETLDKHGLSHFTIYSKAYTHEKWETPFIGDTHTIMDVEILRKTFGRYKYKNTVEYKL